MIKSIGKTLEIDIAYSVNSFIYSLRKLPILKDLITDDIYSSKILKKIVGSIGIILSLLRTLLFKIAYYYLIYLIVVYFYPNSVVKSYLHVYFILTIIGLFINNKTLNTSKKKYFSLILFKMEDTAFFRAYLLWNQIITAIFNIFAISILNYFFKFSINYCVVIAILPFFTRLVGEMLNIMFYNQYKYVWYINTKLYFSILLPLLSLCILPKFNIYITINEIYCVLSALIVLSVPSIIYLLNVTNYRLMYKKLSTVIDYMNSKNENDYYRQAMVELKDKDKNISIDKIKDKKGYDLFNTIFFERHREILSRSAKKYGFIITMVYIALIYLAISNRHISKDISEFLSFHLGYFVLIMYFINRGSIMTQAMFFNCDHAMLNYNFYREANTIVGLFKKRLLTIAKVNLIPAFIIAIGNTIILIILKVSYLNVISSFLFIIILSIFFSTHYLTIYYLLQPYNKHMENKKISYSLISILMYFACYTISQLSLNTETFAIYGLLFLITYIIVSIVLVYKYAPKTFKLS